MNLQLDIRHWLKIASSKKRFPGFATSSAVVELAGTLFMPDRCQLGDNNFQKLMFIINEFMNLCIIQP